MSSVHEKYKEKEKEKKTVVAMLCKAENISLLEYFISFGLFLRRTFC